MCVCVHIYIERESPLTGYVMKKIGIELEIKRMYHYKIQKEFKWNPKEPPV